MPLSSQNTQRTTSESSRDPFAITRDDANDLPTIARGIHANSTGWIRFTGVDAADNTYVEAYVVAGTTYPFWVKRVWSTAQSPAATDLLGLP